MQIEKLHQPYIFKHNNKNNIIVSEIQENKLEFIFGNQNVYESYWKLKILDDTYNLENLVTPDTIEIDSKNYFIIAECNGYVYENKISYVIGVHTKEDNTGIKLFLVDGDLDLENKVVSNIKVLQTTRSGFVKGTDIFRISHKDKQIYKNNISFFNCNDILDTTVRIIGVYGENKIIVTGTKNDKYNSFLIDVDNNTIKKIKNNDGNEVIYKCSLIGDEINGMLSYTDKVYINENEKEHTLNINVGYILENN